jgi:hypothetical protein
VITFEEIMDLEDYLPSKKVEESAKRLDDSGEEEEAKSQEVDDNDDFVIV